MVCARYHEAVESEIVMDKVKIIWMTGIASVHHVNRKSGEWVRELLSEIDRTRLKYR